MGGSEAGLRHRDPVRLLDARLIRCDRCPRLREHCRAVAANPPARFRGQRYWARPVPGFGDPSARLLLVGLAPGAHGSNRTGRMFTGDASGDWLYEALHRFGFASQPESTSRDDGLTLTDCFITAAARCAPPGNRPTPAELANCRSWLDEELALLTRVRVVVGLGRIGWEAYLKAWRRLAAPADAASLRGFTFAHGAERKLPDGTIVIASYHPSRQNTNTGVLTREMWYRIFRRAREAVDDG